MLVFIHSMANHLSYVRFQYKDWPVKYGLIKKFHFSASSEDQIMVLDRSPFEDDFDHPHPNKTVPLKECKLLVPVEPSKIIGIGLNYKDHAIEQGKPFPEVPLVFLKSLNSLTAAGTKILLNRHCSLVHFEGELAVVISKQCKNVTEEEALNYVAGYTIANDVTDRRIQKAEATFARAKGMDGFCPLGPFLVHGVDWQGLQIKAFVNDELKQNGNTREMIHSVPKLISFVSEFMTLNSGDVIITGTPAGVGEIKPGDELIIGQSSSGQAQSTTGARPAAPGTASPMGGPGGFRRM